MRISDEQFISHVAIHGGLALDAAAAASRDLLCRIASGLDGAARAQLIEELPPGLAASVEGRVLGAALPLEEYAGAPGLTAGEAREVLAAVCRVLVEASTERLRVLLAASMPAIAAFLVGPVPGVDPAHPHARGRTLADGEPGSSRPIGGR